jgi:hypothetical protein
MRRFARTVLAGGVLVGIGWSAVDAQQTPQGPPPTPVVATNAPGPEQFSGIWDYNADQSVDAATGRREQNPRTSQRRGAATSAMAPVGPIYSGPAAAAPVPGYAGGTMPGMVLVSELRELTRDLLEIPEQLTLGVADSTVTITDDLDREQTYPTDKKSHKYQLGAAVYHARVFWDGHQLKKEVEGADGQFKLSETYFLSEDGQRLFVVLRVGDPERQGRGRNPINGYNRVYDRVTK